MTALAFRTGWGAGHIQASHGATRLERLERLHLIAKDSEINAMPCSDERALRRQRADRIADAMKAERAAQATNTESCSVCGRPGRAETGLCDLCQEGWDAEMVSAQAFWIEAQA